MGSSKYDPDKLIKAFYIERQSSFHGKWNASGWLKDEEVILLGPGPSVLKRKEQIIEFVRENNLKVFFLNKNHNFPEDYAFTTIISNIDRAMVDLILLKESKSKIILPYAKLKGFLNNKDKDSILDYGLVLEDNKFESKRNYCTLFTPNVSAYALALMYQAGAKKVYLAGLDGYPEGDKRNEVMEKIFSKFKGLTNSPSIVSITETSYKELESTNIISQ
jgi:4-hydroxy 2-oxovalerate aldolase